LIGNGKAYTRDKAIELPAKKPSIALLHHVYKKHTELLLIMTHAINIPNNLSCNIATYETQWPVFTQSNPPEYCGEIHRIAAWQVPPSVHKEFGLPDRTDMYLTDSGHWAPTLEIAEHCLVNTPRARSFKVKGATLGFFVPPQWAEENGNPSTHDDYRVFRTAAGGWDAEEFWARQLVGAGNEF
jgi:hypothetical protein